MGGCVVGCMAMQNEKKMVQNDKIIAVRAIEKQAILYGKPEKENESAPYRSPDSADKTLEEIRAKYYGGEHGTLVRRLKKSCETFADKKAMAYRSIDKFEKGEIEQDGKKKPWEFIHLKETKYITYAELWKKIVSFGNGLKKLGFEAGARVGIYEETRYEWLTACYGMWSQGMTGCTVYANLGEDALIYAIREAELPVMVLNGKAVKNLIRVLKAEGLPIPHLIYNDAIPADVDVEGVSVTSFEEVLKLGEGGEEPNLSENPDDLALIMYTSGTTGDPKGVMITHGNAYAAVAGADARIVDYLDTTEENTYVAYLPLAHILEFTVENIMLTKGAMLGYGNPRTLTDTSAKPHGDLKEYKPTFFAGVPRIYDTIKKAVEAKLPADGVKRRVFDRAYEDRKQALEKGMETPYWNEKAFVNTRALLGGRCKMLVSGGAPLSAKTQEFLSIVFGCAVGQGYGLTETCAACTIQRYYDTKLECIGGLLDNVEVKLVDVEHWKHTNPEPQGEVCIRGPPVTLGYYKQEEKTKEAFMPDGWFHTGDVGQMCADGTIKIIGRVKALAKNSHGEYIAMESLESCYVINDLVMPNGVCVLVHPHRGYIGAIALTDEAKAMKFAAKHNLSGSFPDILQTEEFRAKAIESMAATAKEAGRKPFECVKTVRILAEEWTPENGVLTAASKLKRRVIDEKYKEMIEEMFAKEG